MRAPAVRVQERLSFIKKTVKNTHEYWKHNADRYATFFRFIIESSLFPEEINMLINMGKPQLEFNILEAYGSRLLGEFSKQEPDIEVSADDQNIADPATLMFLSQHLRHVMNDHSNHHTRYNVYKDLLYGGYSALKVTTDYAHPMSFDQVININRVFDPTLCGWDIKAVQSHKGDGKYCFENFPMSREEAEDMDIDVTGVNFTRQFAGFNWAYTNDQGENLIVCDYYEKKPRRIKIVQLVDGRVLPEEEYQYQEANWGGFTQFPAVKGKPRYTEIDHIVRYRCIDTKVVEYTETDFKMLPLIFVDGNSAMIRMQNNGNVHQLTRPYFYHARDAQRMKNFAGISLMNEIENLVQHKFKVSKESLPKEEEWLQAYRDPQRASVLVYNEFDEKHPDKQLTPPQEIQQMHAPPEIVAAFTGSDALIQNILGSYDASLGINDNQLSGVAIVEAATQSNAAAMPYIVGYLQGWQRAAEMYVDLLPKYTKTPRTMPIIDKEGKKDFVQINVPGAPNMFYDSNALNVTVRAGASFQVQKARTINMVKEVMGMSPLFQQFIGEKGIQFLLDNLEGYGIDQLKALVKQWTQEYEQQKAMAMQQAQNDPAMVKNQIEMAKMQQKNALDQGKLQLDMAKLRQAEQAVMADLMKERNSAETQRVKAETERFVHQIDAMTKMEELSLKRGDQHHSHARDVYDAHVKHAEMEHKGEELEHAKKVAARAPAKQAGGGK